MTKEKFKSLIFNPKVVLLQCFIPILFGFINSKLNLNYNFDIAIMIFTLVYPLISLVWSSVNLRYCEKNKTVTVVTYIPFFISLIYVYIEFNFGMLMFLFKDLGV